MINPGEKHMEVIVDDTQLSLAIGKKGQNVRLAAKLLGWKVDIKSEEEKRQEVETQMAALDHAGTPVSVLIDHGLSERLAEKLVSDGHTTVEPLANKTREEIEAIPGIGTEMADDVIIALNAYYAPYIEHPEEDQQVADESGPAELESGSAELESGGVVPESGVGITEESPVESTDEAAVEPGPSTEAGEFIENTTVPVGESDTISEMK